MPNIAILNQETIDKIAAGEVVERPCSVVKELVENAIDAGSTAITVEIKEGGISFIRITDNGCGIERDQVAVAFYRHSTSKIRSAEDLLTVKSLGFRGEALSSISAVARVELITKTYDELTGTRYVIEGSKELSNEEIVVKCIHGGVGAINESDVTLASASNAIIIGFNVRPDATAKATAETEGVDIRLYKVIYQAIEDVEAAMKGMLDPVYEEKIIGHAEVRQIFKASAIGNIAGSYVLDGVFTRGCKVRITREGELIYEGALASLKRFKDDVKEVKAGFECGLVFEGFDKMKEFDVVEAYIMVEVPR